MILSELKRDLKRHSVSPEKTIHQKTTNPKKAANLSAKKLAKHLDVVAPYCVDFVKASDLIRILDLGANYCDDILNVLVFRGLLECEVRVNPSNRGRNKFLKLTTASFKKDLFLKVKID